MTETPRERLARLPDERREELGLLWNEVAERAGLTKEGLRTLRTGTGKMRAPTKRGLEDALRWEAGSVDRILEGSDPSEAPEPPPSAPEPDLRAVLARLAALEQRVAVLEEQAADRRRRK